MSKVPSIKEHLAARFDRQRLVIWRDADGRCIDDLDAQTPPDVTALRIAGDEFAIKHRVLREEPSAKFLLYRHGVVPEGADNWLLDLELAYGTFSADRDALMRADLGITAPGAEELIAAHKTFFGNAKSVAKLKALLRDGDYLVTVQAMMCAALLGQKEHSFSELTRTLLIQHASDEASGYDALVEQDLANFYWGGAEKIYGFESDSPSMAGFVLWMFKQAKGGFAASTSNTARNLEIDLVKPQDVV